MGLSPHEKWGITLPKWDAKGTTGHWQNAFFEDA
jgi:hypothetical protein